MELKEIILTKEWCKKHHNEKFFIVINKNSWLMAHCIVEKNNTLNIMIDCAENLHINRYRTFKIGEFINDYGYFKTFYLKF